MSKTTEKIIIGAGVGACLPVFGCALVLLVALVIIIVAAGGILGWLFGGFAPPGSGSNVPPTGAIAYASPTPYPTISGTVTAPPNWTPPPTGEGPHGSPYRAPYVFTQGYGCTDFPEFEDADCAAQSGGATPYFHRGVDIASMGDKTVYSTIAGQVSFAGWADDGFGIRAYVRAGEYLVIYPHLSMVRVEPGQFVSWGQPIGTEGSTGYSTGSHLHYEIHINGAWVDSTPYLAR